VRRRTRGRFVRPQVRLPQIAGTIRKRRLHQPQRFLEVAGHALHKWVHHALRNIAYRRIWGAAALMNIGESAVCRRSASQQGVGALGDDGVDPVGGNEVRPIDTLPNLGGDSTYVGVEALIERCSFIAGCHALC